MIKEGSKTQGVRACISQNFNICTMPVSVEDQIVDHDHLVDIFIPALGDAEIIMRLASISICLVIIVKGDFALAALLEMFVGEGGNIISKRVS